MKFLLAIIAIAAFVAHCSADYDWNSFKERHGKSYENDENESKAYTNFKQNRDYVNEFNARPEKGFELGLHEYADMDQNYNNNPKENSNNAHCQL